MGRTAKQKNRTLAKYPDEEKQEPLKVTVYELMCEDCKKVCGTLTMPEGKKPTSTYITYCDEHKK